MICPKCCKRLFLNTHGYSQPFYQCEDRGMWMNCNFEMPVREFESTYQGELTRVERIRKKFELGLMEQRDFEFLLSLAEDTKQA